MKFKATLFIPLAFMQRRIIRSYFYFNQLVYVVQLSNGLHFHFMRPSFPGILCGSGRSGLWAVSATASAVVFFQSSLFKEQGKALRALPSFI